MIPYQYFPIESWQKPLEWRRCREWIMIQVKTTDAKRKGNDSHFSTLPINVFPHARSGIS
jgi:hypothetical protein